MKHNPYSFIFSCLILFLSSQSFGQSRHEWGLSVSSGNYGLKKAYNYVNSYNTSFNSKLSVRPGILTNMGFYIGNTKQNKLAFQSGILFQHSSIQIRKSIIYRDGFTNSGLPINYKVSRSYGLYEFTVPISIGYRFSQAFTLSIGLAQSILFNRSVKGQVDTYTTTATGVDKTAGFKYPGFGTGTFDYQLQIESDVLDMSSLYSKYFFTQLLFRVNPKLQLQVAFLFNNLNERDFETEKKRSIQVGLLYAFKH